MSVREKLKVFVSSKEGELDTERAMAIESISSLGLEPISSENRPASENPIEEEYTKELQNSDIYVGIFGKTYSKSTINEFNIARNNKIPVLVFEKNIPDKSRDGSLEKFLIDIKNPTQGLTVSRYYGDMDLRDKITASLSTLLSRKFRQAKKHEEKSLFELVDDTMIINTSHSKPHLISVSVALDRMTYPVGSLVYLRAFAPFLIVREPMIFEVKNNDSVIFYQKIEPINCNQYEIESGIYQTSFVLEPHLCKIGDSITAKFKHGLAESIDIADIKHHDPIIQTDKTYYNSNTDMILTIIDLDANKDSEKLDFVGSRKNSELIIESSKGKLLNCILQETGESTGIFQSIIELVGVSTDTTDQYGLKKDQILVSKKDKVKITYSNSESTAELSVTII